MRAYARMDPASPPLPLLFHSCVLSLRLLSCTLSSFMKTRYRTIQLFACILHNPPPHVWLMIPTSPFSCSLERRALLRDYFLTEPVLQFHIQEPADLYNVCAPDGSCAIQLALLYQCLDPVDWTAELSSHNSSQPFFKYHRRGQPSSTDQSHVLRLVRSLIDSRTEPGSHVRESLEAWRHGLLNNYRSPILKPPQFLDIDEVLQLLPEQASASNFVELPYAPLDTVQHRSWSALQADKRLLTRNTFFSGSDLLRLFAQPVRASALRDSHYYPFLIRSAPLWRGLSRLSSN